jgi:hypothetical protein
MVNLNLWLCIDLTIFEEDRLSPIKISLITML